MNFLFDYLPSQIVFADRTRNEAISKAFGLRSVNELDDFLENHFYITFTLQDKPMLHKNIVEEMERLKKLGYAYPDWGNKIVYDAWGIGYKVDIGSFFVSFHPLQGKTTKENLNFIPKRLWESIQEKDIKIAVRKYTCPDPNMKDNYVEWESDLKKYSGDFLVWPSGYAGIYERSYHILGWEELMTNIALEPKIVEEVLDKVTEYKIETARKVIELGFKMGHAGDDLGTQTSGFFSDTMFKKIILPRLKRYWGVFANAGIPIMFHSCGNITQYIPDLIDIGLKILEPCQPCMDLKSLKKEFGKDLIFYGGINTQTLPYLSVEETKDMVRNTIRILGKGGGYIIAPSQEIMSDVPLENIKALVDTIKEEREIVLYS